MRTVSVESLTQEAFAPFGSYANLINPEDIKFGQPPIEFFRDQVQQSLNQNGMLSFSTCRVEKREPVIDVSEYHSYTGEGILPLDQDILIHVGPATANGDGIPLDSIRVFRVPKGVMITLKPGVWHHAPFTTSDEPANTLIVLPERTYANDCIVVELDEADQIRVNL